METNQTPQNDIMKRLGSVEFFYDDQHAESSHTVKRRRILGESSSSDGSQHHFHEPPQQLSVLNIHRHQHMPNQQNSASNVLQLNNNFHGNSFPQLVLPDIVRSVNRQYLEQPTYGHGSNMNRPRYGHHVSHDVGNNRHQVPPPMELAADHQYCMSPGRSVHQNNSNHSERNQVTGRSFL